MSGDPRADRPRRSGAWRLARRALVALAALLVALLTALHVPPIQRALVGLAVARLQGAIGATIGYQSVHFNLVTRTFDLEGLRLGAPGATPLVAAERIHVRFPWSAFRGSLDGLDVTLEHARVALLQEHGHWTTIPAKWTGGGPSAARPLPAFGALRLHDLDVRYEDRDAGFAADTSGFSVDLLPDGAGGAHRLTGPIAPGAASAVSLGSRGTKVHVAGGQAFYSPEHAGVDRLKLDAREGEISAEVAFSFHGANRLQLRASGTARGETLDSWAPMLQTLRGVLAFNFDMPAARGAPAFADVRVSGRDVAWREVAIARLEAQGALDTGGITLTRTEVGIGAGTADGSGRLAWADGAESHASLAWHDLDAGALWRTLLAGSRGAVWVAPASLVSGRFDGRWSAWHASALDGRASTTWSARPSGPAKGEHLWLDGRIDATFAQGPWTVGVDARADGALDLNGDVRTRGSLADYSRWPLEGRLALAGSAPPVIEDAFRFAGVDAHPYLHQASGAFHGQATLSQTFGTARADLDISSQLEWPDQPAVAIDAHATVDPSALTVDEWHAASGPSSAKASVRLDFDADTIAGTFSGDQLPVEAWTRRFGLGAPVAGVLLVSGTLSGALASPAVDVELRGGPMTAERQTFPGVHGHLAYHDGVLTAEHLTLDGPCSGSATANGTWTPKSDGVDLSLTVPSLCVRYQVPGVTTGSGAPGGELAATVAGSAHVTGTTRRPLVDATFDAPALTLDARDLGPLHARAATSGDRVALAASAPGLGAALDGSVGLDDDRAFTVEASVRTTDSPVAATLRGIDVDLGGIDLTGHAAGSLAGPGVQSADLEVDRLDGTLMGLAVSVHPGARASWRPDSLTVSGVDVSTAGTHLTAAGALDGQPGHELALHLDGQLQDLRPVASHLLPAAYDHAVLDGRFSATLSASGPLARPVGVGAFNLDGASVGDGIHPPATGVHVRGTLDASELKLEVAEGHWQGAHAAIAGTVPAWFLGLPSAPHGGRAALTGHVDDVTIKVLEPVVNADSLNATDFKIGIQYTIGADRPEPDAITADVRVTEASITSRELGLVQQAPGHLVVSHGLARLEPWTIGAPASAGTRLTLAGSASLTGDQTVKATAEGTLDLRALGLLFGTYRPGGTATISATVGGPLASPALSGYVKLEHGELTVRDPRLLFSDVHGTVRFQGDRVTLDGVAGTMNGGAVEASGSTSLPGRAGPQGPITVTARGMSFDVPRGFRSLVDADLQLAARPNGRYLLSGTATIIDAAYRESFIVTGGILSLFQPKGTTVAALSRPAAGPRLQLDLRILADDSIAIDTSYGKVAIGTNLRVLGSPSNVRLLGEADIAPGGQLFVGGHTYQIESGRFDFNDPSSLKPDVYLTAQTTISGYSITLRIESTSGRTETTLSSDPALPEDQISSLLLSGQRQTTGSPGDVVTQQLVSALSGEITSAVGRAIGFDAIRIESGNPGDVLFDASLISGDSNPAQRLTLSKRILPDLEVIVSQNLRESGQITWVVSWNPVKRFELRFVQLDNQDRSYEIRHDISFGGGAVTRQAVERPRETVRDVFVALFGGVSDGDVRGVLRLQRGSRFDFYKWQQDRDRVHALLIERGYYQASVTARRDPSTPPQGFKEGSPVDLGYTIDAGPPTTLVTTGTTVPGTIRRELIDAWSDTPVPSLLGEEFQGVLRPWLAAQDYLQPSIQTQVSTEGGRTVATVNIDAGARYTHRTVRFAGNDHADSQQLSGALGEAGLDRALWTSPGGAKPVLEEWYRGRGYLACSASVGQPTVEGDRADLLITVREGPLFRVGVARVDDPEKAAPAGVDTTSPVPPGTILTDDLVRSATRELQRRYRAAGYRGTRIQAESTARQDGSTVDLVFHVTRGRLFTFGTLTVAGVEGKERNLVAQTVPFAPGKPVSLDDVADARNRLYDMDLFRTVSIDANPRAPSGGQPAPPVMDATVTVEPLPKYRLRYGFQLFDPYKPSVDPKWGAVDPGIVVDLTRRGLFGRGLTGGLAARVNPSNRVARGYLSSREFLGRPLQTNLYVGDQWQREVDRGFPLQSHKRDLTLEQRLRYRGVQVGYGYNFQRLNQDLLVDVPTLPFPIPVNFTGNISRLISSAYIDRRDNAIDTSTGWFHSSSLEFAPEWLGSTSAFRKYLGQQFLFLPLARSAVLGSAVRFEYASGPGQVFIVTERLRAGGANTVRGYDDLSLARLTSGGAASGQTSLLVLNEELRFPVAWRIRGATFWDHATFFGAVPLPGDQRQRNSLGAGLRLVLPFILVRVDYGYPLDKDPVNQGGHWYFAIGQAF